MAEAEVSLGLSTWKKRPIKWNWISWNFLILCHQFVSQICSSSFALSKAWLNLRHHRLWVCEKKKIHFLLSSYFWNVWFSGREERDGFVLLGWGYTESEPSVCFNLSRGYLCHLSCLQNCQTQPTGVTWSPFYLPKQNLDPVAMHSLGMLILTYICSLWTCFCWLIGIIHRWCEGRMGLERSGGKEERKGTVGEERN